VKSKKDIVFNIAHLIDSLHLIKIISREQTLTYAKQHMNKRQRTQEFRQRTGKKFSFNFDVSIDID